MRHVDGGLRWATEIVATRATSPPPDVALRDLSGFTDEDPSRLTESLTEAAEQLRSTLTEAGPDAQMWCPVDGGGSAFYARRFAHETVIHRADAAIALGVEYLLDTDVAIDGVDEWLELGCLPFHFDVHPWMRELLGPDRTIGLHATDNGRRLAAGFHRRRDRLAAGPTMRPLPLRGPVTDLLLTIYRRMPLDSGGIEVTGDTGLVDFWLERVGFG